MELLERDDHLRSVAACLEGALQGRGSVVLLPGSAGAGKSSVARAAQAAAPPDVRCWWGAHDPFATPRPFGPLHDIAEQDDAMRTLLDESAGPELAVRLQRQLDDQPTMLVIDDVHWADDATTELLVHLGRRMASTSSVLLLAYRPAEADGAVRRLLAALATAEGVHRLPVEPLGGDAVAELAVGTPHDPDEVLRLTGGNAFYVTELLSLPELGVPAGVADVVRARAGGLPRAGLQVLELVSLAPGGLERDLATTILDTQTVRDGVDACSAVGLLREERGQLLFRHELGRLAVEAWVPHGRRTALRRRLLHALEDLGEVDVTRLVHHADQLGDHPRIVEYSVLAAAEAEQREAWRQAAAHLSRVLDTPVERSDRDRLALLVRLALAEERMLGHRPAMVTRRRQVIAAAEEVGDVAQATYQRLWLARSLRASHRNEEANAVVDEIRNLLTTVEDSPLLAVVRLEMALEFLVSRGQFSEALEAIDRALEATDIATPEALMHATVNRAHIAAAQRGPSEAAAAIAAAVAAAERHSSWDLLLFRRNHANWLLTRGLLAEAREQLEEVLALLEHIDTPMGDVLVAHLRAYAALRAGNHHEASRHAQIVLDRHALPVDSYFVVATATVAAAAAIRTGTAKGELLDRAWESAASKPWDLDLVWPLVAATDEAGRYGHDVSHHEARVAETWRIIAESEDPAARGELLVRRPDLAGDLTPADVDEPWRQLAVGDWRGAAAVWEERGCVFEQAEALALGDEKAQRAALGLFEDIGAVPAADRVRAQLREQGFDDIPARDRSTPADSDLTKRQLEVLLLVAEGLTNADIAERLFLSPKTVGHHVSAVLSRLEVRSRTAAVTEARRRGLLET